MITKKPSFKERLNWIKEQKIDGRLFQHITKLDLAEYNIHLLAEQLTILSYKMPSPITTVAITGSNRIPGKDMREVFKVLIYVC